MANYIIQWTDKTLKSSIALYTGVVDDTTTSLTLYGKNAPNWGEKSEENLLHLMEHFASNGRPPQAPTDGQIWYNALDKKLKVYWNGKWNDIGYRRIDSPTVPGDNNYPGTLWFDTRNNVLKVRNKSGNWIPVFQYHGSSATPTPTPYILPTPTPLTVTGNPTPLSPPTNPLTPSGPIVVTDDNQIVKDLYIIATGGSSGVTVNGFNNVVIKNCFIVHADGAGIDVRNSNFTTIEYVEIDCTGSPTTGPGTITSYNIHAQDANNLTIGNVELYDGSTGILAERCDDLHVYTINGFNFRGPAPRGEFIALDTCTSPTIEDFYNKQDPTIGWNDSNIYCKNCSDVTIRRGCLDGSNGTEGAGVYFTYDNALASGGVVENVDAINMGNGAFAASPAQNVIFRYCRVKDNHTAGVGGRPAPYSGGLVFHAFDGNHVLELGGNPNNIATNLKIEGCVLYNLANPNTIVFDRAKFTSIDYAFSDFTPRSMIYIKNMPHIGASPSPVGPDPVPTPAWTYSPAGVVINITTSPGQVVVTPGMTPAPVAPTPGTTPTPTVSPSPWGSPAPAPTPAAQIPIKPLGVAASDYPSLVFNEDFNGGLPSQVFIDHMWYASGDGVINYSVENGELLIWPESNFVDRHINTDGLFEFRYGFVEWKAKLPYGQGVWPALWLYAHPGDERDEIDVMEAYASAGGNWSNSSDHPLDFGITLHEANGNYTIDNKPYAKKLSDFGLSTDLSADYHVYGMRWTANEISFYFDGKQLDTWPNDGFFTKQMYLLMSLQFGSIAGSPDGTTPLGKSNAFRIQYLRVWNLSDGSTLTPNGTWLPTSSPTTVPAPTPVPAPNSTTPTPTFVGSNDPRPNLKDATIQNRIGAMSFRDEFDGNSLNTTIWSPQVYDDKLTTGGYGFSNSCLNIWPITDSNGNFVRQSFGTSDGSPNNAKFYQKYGYFEARLKLPRGLGVWPAFYLYSSDTGYYPTDTVWLRPEIDIMEAYPGGGVDGGWGTSDLRPTNYGGTVWKPDVCDQTQSCHSVEGGTTWSHGFQHFDPQTGPDLSAQFYTYACLWDSTGVEFFWDGTSIGKVPATDQTYRMFMYLDLWYGSASGTPNTTDTPQGPSNAYSIDWVRAWKLADGSSTISGTAPLYVPNTGSNTTPTPIVPSPATSSGTFTITSVTSPADGATVSGTVNLVVHGTNLANVELIPATSYTPKYGTFTVASGGGSASLSWDTTKLVDGNYSIRIECWNVAAGQTGGTELTAITRTWKISNGNTGTSSNSGSAGSTNLVPIGPMSTKYSSLIFQDEFDGSSLDTGKWQHGCFGIGVQPSAVQITNSLCRLWVTGSDVSLTTNSTWKYGYFEAKMKLCHGPATWPAWWLIYMGPKADPYRPEFDFMEAYPGGPYERSSPYNYTGANCGAGNFDATIHPIVGINNNGDPGSSHYTMIDSTLSDSFHVYGCEWRTDGYFDMYFDGKLIWQCRSAQINDPMNMVLDIWYSAAMGDPSLRTTGSTNAFEIDYVRIWGS